MTDKTAIEALPEVIYAYVDSSEGFGGHWFDKPAPVDGGTDTVKYIKSVEAVDVDSWLKADPNADYNLLKQQFFSLKSICAAQGQQLSVYRKKSHELSEKRLAALEESLESERQMNFQLTEELEKLRTPIELDEAFENYVESETEDGSALISGWIDATDVRIIQTALTHLRETVEAGQYWQDIETAPHDKLALLYCPERCAITNKSRVELDYASQGSRTSRSSSVSLHSWATHWMPLPKPPTQSETIKKFMEE